MSQYIYSIENKEGGTYFEKAANDRNVKARGGVDGWEK